MRERREETEGDNGEERAIGLTMACQQLGCAWLKCQELIMGRESREERKNGKTESSISEKTMVIEGGLDEL